MNQTAQLTWENCLSFIKDNVPEQAYKTWFEPIRAVELSGDVLHIEVPSRFFYEWLEEHYVKLLKLSLTKELGENAKLLYRIKPVNSNEEKQPFVDQLASSSDQTLVKSQKMDFSLQNRDPELRNPFIIPGIKNIKIEAQLNPSYDFDSFLEGDANRLARSAGIAVSKKPGGTSFNPLLIFGGVGLGKTHLANAIGLKIKEKYPEKKVLYVSSEVFTQQFIESVRRNTRNDFIHFYQLLDVLIVDDIQFLSGKSGTQDVFFHIFNHLHQNGKQVVLTSDKAPVDIQDIEHRLLSRFKWGLSAELQKPDYETRFSILKNILYRDGVDMRDEIVEYIAQKVKTNVRELEGATISLIAQSSFNKKEITLNLAKEIVDKFVKNIKREISIDFIQKVVAEYFHLKVEELHLKTRKRHIVQARQLAMFFAKKYTKFSLQNIGFEIGRRDYSTVIHSCKTVDNLLETNKQFKQFVEDIDKKLSM